MTGYIGNTVFILYKIEPKPGSIILDPKYCDTIEETENAVRANKQYCIILACKVDDVHEISPLFSLHDISKVYIIGQYNTTIEKIQPVDDDGRDKIKNLMWHLMNEAIGHIHKQESKYRKEGNISLANTSASFITDLIEKMDNLKDF